MIEMRQELIVILILLYILPKTLHALILNFPFLQDLLTFMSAPNLNTEEDRKNEVEFLKQTMENFARISDILLQIEQDYPHRYDRNVGRIIISKVQSKFYDAVLSK